MTNRPWSIPVRLDEIPETGLPLDLEGAAPTPAAGAGRAAGKQGPRLAASFDLARHGREGMHVVGTVFAQVLQTCVVTLDPVENQIEEGIDIVFAAPTALGPAANEVNLGAEAV